MPEFIVNIMYTTDADGRPLDFQVEDYALTQHGPFSSTEEAEAWIDEQPPEDDVEDYVVLAMPNPRPTILNDPKERSS